MAKTNFNEQDFKERKEKMKKVVIYSSVVILLLLIVTGIVGILTNTNWYINNQLAKIEVTNRYLFDNVTYSYRNEYDNDKMKIYVSISNLDNATMQFYSNYNAEAFKIEFLDKEGYKVTDITFNYSDFTMGGDEVFRAKQTIRMNKRMVKEIKEIKP